MSDQTMSPWGGKERYWPKTPAGWSMEPLDRTSYTAYDDLEQALYQADGLDLFVEVDVSPWTTSNLPESKGYFTYKAEFYGKTKKGKIPVKGYKKNIADTLAELAGLAEEAQAKFVEKLESLAGGNWLPSDLNEIDAAYIRENEDGGMSVTFMDPVEALCRGSSAEAEVTYSEGSDYEGAYGVQTETFEYSSMADMRRILKEADKLWEVDEREDDS